MPIAHDSKLMQFSFFCVIHLWTDYVMLDQVPVYDGVRYMVCKRWIHMQRPDYDIELQSLWKVDPAPWKTI